MATSKKSNMGFRRGLTKEKREKIAQQIVEGYQATDGCPPLSTHWGGYELGKTDWIKRFAEEIADCKTTGLAWNTVKEKCDASFIVELLYLLTLREESHKTTIKMHIMLWYLRSKRSSHDMTNCSKTC